eukprot:763764-Prymnesium_polylepis.2
MGGDARGALRSDSSLLRSPGLQICPHILERHVLSTLLAGQRGARAPDYGLHVDHPVHLVRLRLQLLLPLAALLLLGELGRVMLLDEARQ